MNELRNYIYITTKVSTLCLSLILLLQSDDGDVCHCCPLPPTSKCPEEKLLELHPSHSCSTMRVLLKVCYELNPKSILSRNARLV